MMFTCYVASPDTISNRKNATNRCEVLFQMHLNRITNIFKVNRHITESAQSWLKANWAAFLNSLNRLLTVMSDSAQQLSFSFVKPFETKLEAPTEYEIVVAKSQIIFFREGTNPSASMTVKASIMYRRFYSKVYRIAN